MPHRVVIVRSLPGLGDLLCVVPALRALRAALPDAEVTLVGLAHTRSMAERFGQYLNHWQEFPGYPGIPEGWLGSTPIPPFLQQMQRQRYDLALQMHGDGSLMNPFTVLLGASLNAGFYSPGQFCPDPDRFLPYPEEESEIHRYLRLLEHLGIPNQGTDLEFPIYETDYQTLRSLPELQSLQPGRYVCIHPGASTADRRWSPLGFAVVANCLAKQGYEIVLTGTPAEAELTRGINLALETPAIDLAGKTSLGSLAALLEGAALLVCNDTGISHLAAALKVKSVVIFSNSDPLRWSPLDRNRHRVVHQQEGFEHSLQLILTQVNEQLQAEVPCAI